MKKKEEYERGELFPISDDVYKKKLLNDTKKKIKKTTNSYKIKTDIRDIGGDGILIKTGYNLSSVWGSMNHRNAEMFPFSIELPKNERGNLVTNYSKTNLQSIERIIKTYMRTGDFFIELCCGWSTFGTMAAYFGYSGVGVDIWDVAIDHSRKQYNVIKDIPNVGIYDVVKIDAMDTQYPSEFFSVCYCNPPFMDIEKYSNNDNDVAGRNESEFYENIKKLLNEAKRICKKESLIIFTINDVRREGVLISMQSIIISIGQSVGLNLHDFVISENPTGAAMIMRKTQYEKRRTAKMHEYIITFKK